MANNVQFQDFSMQVKDALEEAAIQFLHEASGEMVSEIKRTVPVDTGQLKNSFEYKLKDTRLESTIGSPLENAIWNEFGTGEYALNGDGRKGGWFYEDRKGEGHFTHGKHPQRTMHKAFTKLKPKIIKRAEQVLKGTMK